MVYSIGPIMDTFMGSIYGPITWGIMVLIMILIISGTIYAPTKTHHVIYPIIPIIRISGIWWFGVVIQMITSFGPLSGRVWSSP